MADNEPCNAAAIVGSATIARLREAGMAVVPFDVPDYAVGEVMTWTGCSCPNVAWEAINCALNLIANRHDDDNPAYIETMRRLGSGELSLEEWRQQSKAASAGLEAPTAETVAAEPASTGGPITPEQRETEIARLVANLGGTREEALAFWCENRFDLSDADRAFHLADGSKPDAAPPVAVGQEPDAPSTAGQGAAEPWPMSRERQIQLMLGAPERRAEFARQAAESPALAGVLARYDHLARG